MRQFAAFNFNKSLIISEFHFTRSKRYRFVNIIL